VFFQDEAASEEKVYDAWNGYQRRRGKAAIIQMAPSVEHVLGVTGVLQGIGVCREKHVLDRLEAIPALLHIGLLELVDGGSPPTFPAWALRGLRRGELRGDLPIAEFLTTY
jgi:hypothetical protein